MDSAQGEDLFLNTSSNEMCISINKILITQVHKNGRSSEQGGIPIELIKDRPE